MTSEQLAGRFPSKAARWSIDRSVSIQWAIFLITVPLVTLPIAPMIYQSFIDRPVYDSGHVFTLGNFVRLFTSPVLLEITINTLIFACISTAISQFFGAIFAILIGRTNLPWRRVMGILLLYPHLISALVLSFGWFLAYGSAGFVTLFVKSYLGIEPWSLYSLWGMSIVAGTTQIPLALLFCLSAVALADPTLEDAARTCGAGPLQALRHVTLPLLTPAIVYSGVLNFIGALEALSIPLIFGEPAGVRLFMAFLYTSGFRSASPDYGLMSTAALLLLGIVAALVYLQSLIMRNARRFVTVSGKASRPRLFDLGTFKWPLFAFVAGFVLLFVIFPICILALRAVVSFLSPLVPFWKLFTAQFVTQVFTEPTTFRSIANSLFVGAVGGLVATAFIAMVAIVVHRSPFPLARELNLLAMVPRALPGLIAGIGMFYAVILLPDVGWLRNSLWLLILVFTIRGIPTGYGALTTPLHQISFDLDRSARVMGGDWWTSIRSVVIPLMKPALASSFVLMFIGFFKDYATAVFLVAPGTELIGPTMLSYWLQGDTGPVAVLGAVQVLVTVIFIAIAQRLLGVDLFGRARI